jgi:hypothetical protein
MVFGWQEEMKEGLGQFERIAKMGGGVRFKLCRKDR